MGKVLKPLLTSLSTSLNLSIVNFYMANVTESKRFFLLREQGELFYRFLIIGFSLLSIGFSSLLFFPNKHTNASSDRIEKAVFSIRAQNETLIKIFQKISNASGYVIVVNTELGNSPMSIQLSNVNVHEAIKRILQKYNHLAYWDENKKRLELYVFDSKIPPVYISGKQIIFEPTTKTIID